MAHQVDFVWFRDNIPSPDPQSSNEMRTYVVRKGGASNVRLAGVAMDDIELVGDEIVLTCGGAKRSVPLSNVAAYEPPRPQRGRPKGKPPTKEP